MYYASCEYTHAPRRLFSPRLKKKKSINPSWDRRLWAPCDWSSEQEEFFNSQFIWTQSHFSSPKIRSLPLLFLLLIWIPSAFCFHRFGSVMITIVIVLMVKDWKLTNHIAENLPSKRHRLSYLTLHRAPLVFNGRRVWTAGRLFFFCLSVPSDSVAAIRGFTPSGGK